MKLSQALAAEIKQEAENTNRLFKCIPDDKFDWRPHKKSMTLKQLATHIAELASWPELILSSDELDFANNNLTKPEVNSTADLIALHNANTADTLTKLGQAQDADFTPTWTLRNGETVLLTLPKHAFIRSMSVNHLYHHRAQLGVYLRLLDIPIPGMYGPSADDLAAAKH